jgi:hypothetical protein
MTRLFSPAPLVLLPIFLFALTTLPVHAETTREKCERTSRDNAALRRCIAETTTAETTTLVGKACSARRCLIKMTCGEVKESTSCEGSGYVVKFVRIETGTDIEITDDKGRTTNMSRCGTCNELDYEDGPLRDADIRSGEGFIVLDVPK